MIFESTICVIYEGVKSKKIYNRGVADGERVMDWEWMVYFVGAFILGSIPFGQIVSKRVASIDITTRGSGNIGATNVAREIGMKWGIVTLLLDMLKGFVPVLRWYDVPSGGRGGTGFSVLLGCGAMCSGGHQFSCFRRFRGGKGVATALGVYLCISPLSTFLALVLFVLIVAKWNYILWLQWLLR